MTVRGSILALHRVMAATTVTGFLAAGCTDVWNEGLRPIETSLGATNLSAAHYVVFQIRVHETENHEEDYASTPLLPPGATHRIRFLDILGDPCPPRVDLRVFLFARVNGEVPIGLDPGEELEPEPHAAGEVLNLPACDTQVVETYTVVNWDAPRGLARVKIAQDTRIDAAIRSANIFSNVDAVWEIVGVDSGLWAPPAAPAVSAPISGEVIRSNGSPVAGVGVLLRTRFRVRLDDGNAGNDPDAGFGAPIAVTATDANGAFFFERPPGAYRVEFFSDDLAFRPAVVDLETPSERIVILAEPRP